MKPLARKVSRPDLPTITRWSDSIESPAPWKPVEREDGMYGVTDYQGWPVPGCSNCGENAGVYEPNDARLIAAAPDLLNYIEYLESELRLSGWKAVQ